MANPVSGRAVLRVLRRSPRCSVFGAVDGDQATVDGSAQPSVGKMDMFFQDPLTQWEKDYKALDQAHVVRAGGDFPVDVQRRV